MAFPTILGFGGTNSGGNVTTTTVDIVTRVGGTPRINDLVLIVITKDGTGAFTWPAGWTACPNFPVTYASTNNQGVLDARYRYIQNGDNLSPAITHASEGTAHQVYWLDGTAAISGTPDSAVATGDSTNPNPPSLTPAWGSADTLWLAVAADDGNTAITAGPASYTNFQNDRWANTNGVGIASARRNNTTATEDPGTFTMTTEQWGAGTIAINPGIAVPDLLNRQRSHWPTHIPRTVALGLAGLTVTVNLLQTTLGAMPFTPPVWPLPPPGGQIMVAVSTSSQETVVAAPFTQRDWPNPAPRPGRLSIELSTSSQEPVGAAPFTELRWVNPSPRLAPAPGWTQDRKFYYQDPYPVGAGSVDAAQATRRSPVTAIPNLLTTTLAPTGADPFVPVVDGGVPRRVLPTLTWTQDRPQYYQDPSIPRPLEGPLPLLRARPWRMDATAPSLLLTTLAPSTGTPFSQTDWPNPGRRAGQLSIDLSTRSQEPSTAAPLTVLSWPNPRVRVRSMGGWTQDRPFYYPSDIPPSTLWDTTPGRRGQPLSFTATRSLVLETVPAPVVPPVWSVPTRQRDAVRFDPPALLQTTLATPFGSGAWPLPVRALQQTGGWVQPRPQDYVDTGILRQSDWPLPPPRTPALRLNGWTQNRPSFYQDPATVGAATLPDRIPPLRPPVLSWTQDRPQYYIDTAIPASGDWPVPTRKLGRAHTWTSSVLSLDDPLRPSEWALPRGVLRLVSFPTPDLLLTTLAPTETPFTGVVLPLPSVRGAAPPIWTQDRKSYYTDPYPNVQSDWPNPRIPRSLRLGVPSTILPNLLPPVVAAVIQDKFTLGTKESISSTGQPTLGGPWSW